MPNQIKLHPDGMDRETGLFGTRTQLEEVSQFKTPQEIFEEWLFLRYGYMEDSEVRKAS